MNRWLAAVAAGVVACIGVGGCARSPDPELGSARRVFIVSLPGLSWSDASTANTPTLLSLADRSAIGNLANRVGRNYADLPAAYLTMGAGTRAVAGVPETGIALGPGETVEGRDLTDLLQRRSATMPPDGIVYLAAGPTLDRNRATVFGAEVGMLGDRLAAAGVLRGVVANGDEVDELQGFGSATTTVELHREAAAMLMGADGALPAGDVSQELLARDPSRPYGVRYDIPVVLGAVDEVLTAAGDRGSVVLVEASDLARYARYRPEVSPSRSSALRQQALRDADQLLAGVLAMADQPGDAVVVVGAPTSAGRPALGLAVVHTDEATGGFLRSPTTGRDGYVQLADMGPTILGLLGVDAPASAEGRAVTVTDRPADAVARLAADIGEARFRDDTLPAVTVAFIGANAVLLAMAAWRRWRPRPEGAGGPSSRSAWGLRLFAHSILGAAAATFIVGAEAISTTDELTYAASVLGIGLLVGLVASGAEARRRGAGTFLALAVLVAVIALDVAVGASLQVNTAFGYSVAVAGRFTGIGNLGFSLFGAGALLLAVLLADRSGRTAWPAAFAILGAALLIDGFPLLGADVGGTLTLTPAFALAALALLGVRLRLPHLVAAALLGVVLTLAFAAIDLARPEHLQTHLARFARLVLDQEWSVLADSLGRRLQASFGGVETAAWLAVLALAVGTVVYIVLLDRGRRPLQLLQRDQPPALVAAAVGLTVLGLIGWIANDSSVAVPATMMIVVVPVLVDRALLSPSTEAPA